MVAEMIITNAKVLTMDEARPRAEAVALAGGRILAVGSRAEVEALAGPGCRVVDAGGRTLLPGFVESHMHLFGGAELQHLQLTGRAGDGRADRGLRPLCRREPGRAGPDGGRGGLRADRRPMTRGDLDQVLADRPIAIRATDHHTVWANTALPGAGGAAAGRGHAGGA